MARRATAIKNERGSSKNVLLLDSGSTLLGQPDADETSGLAEVLKALAVSARLRIVLLLRERELCVCELTEALGLSQGTVSHHLAILRDTGLVRERRDPTDERWVYCSVDPVVAERVKSSLCSLLDTSRFDAGQSSCCARGKQRAC